MQTAGPLAYVDSQSWLKNCMDIYWKKSHVNRPAQCKPVLFKSHLYLEEVIA